MRQMGQHALGRSVIGLSVSLGLLCPGNVWAESHSPGPTYFTPPSNSAPAYAESSYIPLPDNPLVLPGRISTVQMNGPTASPLVETTQIPVGTAFQAILMSPLHSRESYVGDQFQLSLVEDLVSSDGLGMIPKGSFINARIMEVQDSQLARIKAKIAIRFYEIVTPDGRTIPIDATVNSESGYLKGNKRQGQLMNFVAGQAVKTGVRLAAGAAAGYGVGIVLFTVGRRGKDVILKEGTPISIRLNQAIFAPDLQAASPETTPLSTGFIPVSHPTKSGQTAQQP